ncbi:MAG: GNAT family N-acetyltransferase [Planctomycetota bacterium]
MAEPWIVRPLRPTDDGSVRDIIHDVMTEHGCGGEGFALHDPEVACMSASYRDEASGYFVVVRAGTVHGGGGFARLEGSTAQAATAELRKMYFRPSARGLGLGRALLELLLDEMRTHRFRRCYLETTSWMDDAQRLYRAAGFAEQPEREGATGHHGCDKFFSRPL